MATATTIPIENAGGEASLPASAPQPPSPPPPSAQSPSPPDHNPASPPPPHPPSPPTNRTASSASSPAPTPPPPSRTARFLALKSRATAASRANLSATRAEAAPQATDPALAAALARKAAIASHDLLKLDTDAAEGPGAFERKRAWDYTVEESERWDARMAAKREHRDNNAFADFGAEAAKNYERQLRGLEMGEKGRKGERNGDGGGGMARRREEYDAQKAGLVEQAARSGGLEIVEDAATGELVAVDAAGTFFAGRDSVHTTTTTTGGGGGKPEREKVDALVRELEKAEEVRLRKRRARGAGAEDDDAAGAHVTYINQKNKEFNKRLARAYDGYTREVRESFERGTAL
jgi:pre-mRNA-splicing factor SYF2